MKRVTDKELMTALIYCGRIDADLCELCAYNKVPSGECSKALHRDAVARLKEYIQVNKDLNGLVNLVHKEEKEENAAE